MTESILLVDDDMTFTKIVEQFLKRKGYTVDTCHNVADAGQLIKKHFYSLLLLDYRLPDGTGLDIMNEAHSAGRSVPVVIMTSFNDVRTAVKAIRSGAFDYITKPVNQEELLMLVAEALRKEGSEAAAGTDDFLMAAVEGISETAQKLYHQVRLIAPTDMSIIIQGESGTGKEHIARQIHTLSARAGKPFVAVDCGTLSAELASSELFGHVKGAFTGALHHKTGKFEEADGGTLFLDEVGNLGYEVQVKLLRALQERMAYPVGGSKMTKFDVRIITATNEDLKAAAQNGKFRDDLYHRLNEFKISVPPLRQRTEDLDLFVEHFIALSNKVLHKKVSGLAPEVVALFHRYDWPGNVRELKNIIKRLVLLSDSEIAGKEDLPDDMLEDLQRLPSPGNSTDLKYLQEVQEKELIEKTLREAGFNKLKAAKLLNINRSTLYAKMEKYDIKL